VSLRVGECRRSADRSGALEVRAATRFTHAQVGDIVDGAFTRFEQRVPDLPSEPTLGSRQNVMLATLTLCSLEALAADSQIVLVACSPAELPTRFSYSRQGDHRATRG
jgi:hypothetical protein